jgi:hypothetical protein
MLLLSTGIRRLGARDPPGEAAWQPATGNRQPATGNRQPLPAAYRPRRDAVRGWRTFPVFNIFSRRPSQRSSTMLNDPSIATGHGT